MPTIETFPSTNILNQAERELGAFLQAAKTLVGPEGLSHARDLWIETLKDPGCPGAEPPRFFRSVTIRTISQLAESSKGSLALRMNSIDPPLNICAQVGTAY